MSSCWIKIYSTKQFKENILLKMLLFPLMSCFKNNDSLGSLSKNNHSLGSLFVIFLFFCIFFVVVYFVGNHCFILCNNSSLLVSIQIRFFATCYLCYDSSIQLGTSHLFLVYKSIIVTQIMWWVINFKI